MAIRAVVFDIGGVLEITPPTGWGSRWEQRLGVGPGELGERIGEVSRLGKIGAITEAEAHRRIGQALALAPEQVDALMADMWVEYLGTLNSELVDYVRDLRPCYRTAIISNSFVGARAREQDSYGLADLVEFIIYSHEVGVSKPDPRIYHLTCDRLGVRPDEVIFVDDAEWCVEGARAIGIHSVRFETTAQTIADIESLLRVPC